MRYCIWNNKGGVGKTFLTYTLATEYAKKNPDKIVIVADMCPQSNVSEMLLGGNGTGEENLFKIHNQKKTISHYIAERLKSPYNTSLTGSETSYYITPKDYNKKIPENIGLIAGSSDLDLYSKGIEFFANASRQANQKDAWKNVKSWLASLMEVQKNRLLNARYKDVVFFIDCNPSFASYTELALVASDRLIVPCTADGASVRALKNVFKIIYGIGAEDEFIASFSKDMKENNLTLPKIALIIQNRNRNNNKQPSKAFDGVRENIDDVQKQYFKEYPSFFAQNFKLETVKDCNALLPIISYGGEILSDLVAGKKYPVYKKDSTANQGQLKSILSDVERLLKFF
jgi:cellulose biosynthesis protein BcsQ